MWFWKHVVLAVDSIDVVFVGVCAEMVKCFIVTDQDRIIWRDLQFHMH